LTVKKNKFLLHHFLQRFRFVLLAKLVNAVLGLVRMPTDKTGKRRFKTPKTRSITFLVPI